MTVPPECARPSAVDRTVFTLQEFGTGTRVELPVDIRLVIAGFTGRNRDAVRAHIEELAAIGVPAPASVPVFYRMPPHLLDQSPEVTVRSAATSGEVELVLVRTPRGSYLGLGSDHTDRALERRSIEEAKAACPKPIATQVVSLQQLLSDLDRCELRCTVDGVRYQRGTVSELLPPRQLLAMLDTIDPGVEQPLVMYCGTIPVIGEIRYGRHWELELALPDGRVLRHTYSVTQVSHEQA